jgi:hypothetical protein
VTLAGTPSGLEAERAVGPERLVLREIHTHRQQYLRNRVVELDEVLD